MAAASWDKTIKVWDVATGKNTVTLEESEYGDTSVTFSPDSKTLVVAWNNGSRDKTIKIWDVNLLKEVEK